MPVIRNATVFTGAALLACAMACARAADARIEELLARARSDDLAYGLAETLTTEVGARMPGTPQEARAREWAVQALVRLGFANVRIEPFKVRAWTRVSEYAEVVHPFRHSLVISALGNSTGTLGEGIEAEVVRFADHAALAAATVDEVRGRIVFVDERMQRSRDGSSYKNIVPKRSLAAFEGAKRGALAVLIRSHGTGNDRFAHTGGMRYARHMPAIPIAALAVPDADLLSRALERDRVRVRLALDVRGGGRSEGAWESRPEEMSPSGNVVAEIAGTTDEIVLVSAHLDSWDLGTGALDDAAGVGIVIAATKLVADQGKPRRTVRIVLFGAEEAGIAGAWAYMAGHRAELGRHVLAAEADLGGGPVYRFETRWAESALGERETFMQAVRPLGIELGGNSAVGGPDLQFLAQAGVPLVSLVQDASDYYDVHHTANDTFDKIDPIALRQNVAAWAVLIHIASQSDASYRPRLP